MFLHNIIVLYKIVQQLETANLGNFLIFIKSAENRPRGPTFLWHAAHIQHLAAECVARFTDFRTKKPMFRNYRY